MVLSAHDIPLAKNVIRMRPFVSCKWIGRVVSSNSESTLATATASVSSSVPSWGYPEWDAHEGNIYRFCGVALNFGPRSTPAAVAFVTQVSELWLGVLFGPKPIRTISGVFGVNQQIRVRFSSLRKIFC